MEYLMTYGWAILIIAVVLGALFQLGVFNSSSFSPRAPPGACQVFRPSGPGTTTNINLMGVCTGLLPQYAAQFNGASGYIALTQSFYSTPTTMSVWVNVPAYSGRVGIILGDYPSTSNINFEIESSGRPRIYWNNGQIDWLVSYDATNKGWINLVFARDVSAGLIRFYLNGAQLSTYSGVGTTVIPSDPYSIGADRRGSGVPFFHGAMANLQVYNTTLSANEIQAMYLGGIGSAPLVLQNLMGWWPLNGNSNDYSGNNNNGVPTAVTFTSQYGK